ncbi:general odorant-binding protein 56a-like [Periplaneta americana]|uniref:general odorant-binding protein 56a-like n=1 Tax=Periplaneta americana TaxID=6978 RepID=UPI0037E76152
MSLMASLLLCVFSFFTCSAEPTTFEEIEEIQHRCQEENGITNEMFLEMRKKEMILEDESNESQKCFIDCMLVGLGMIKSGEVDVTTIMNIAQPLLDSLEGQGKEINEEYIKTEIKNCSIQSTEQHCTDGYVTWKCLHDIMVNMMHPVPENKAASYEEGI